MDIFSDNIQHGDLLTAETFQNIHSFLKGSHVAGGSVSAQGISVPSEFARNPRTVRFIAEEAIETYSIIELTEQVEDTSGIDNQVPTFKAKPATGDAGTLFYTESAFADVGEAGMAYSIGGEPILIRSSATEDGSPDRGTIVAHPGGAFRYLGESDVSELKWFLPVQGGGVSDAPKSSKVRLVQPKELFPACEYKSLQDVYDCTLEYSDDGTDWIPAVKDGRPQTADGSRSFDIVGGRIVHTLLSPDSLLLSPSTPHKYWRVNLKGFSKPADPNDPYADRGFYTFGRLWKALFWVKREVETKKTAGGTEYTFTANVPDHWIINQADPLLVELSLSPAVSGGTLFYKPSTGDWKSLGSFSSDTTVLIPADDMVDGRPQTADGSRGFNTAFQFKVEADEEEVANLTLRRPTYTLSPERPASFSLTESPVTSESNGCTMTAKVTSQWTSSKQQVSVNIVLTPPVLAGKLYYRPVTGEWQELGEIYQEKTVSIPEADWDELDDAGNPKNTSFEFAITQNGADIVGLVIPRPSYPMTSDAAEIAMPPPRSETADGRPQTAAFDGKPTPRKSQNHRYWMLTFDQPEVVTQVKLDVDQHCEHYIVCPGGRDAFKQDVSFIYSFDLAAETWTATTFPEMQKPMFNMDAKVVELADKTHQLVVLSGQVANGFSNIIQGYNFEKDYVQNIVDMGEGSINFAGRPALAGDPMVRWVNTSIQYPSGETDFSRSLIVVGGSEKSCSLDVHATSVMDSVLFSVQGSTLATGKPYRIQTQNTSMSNVGHTGLPFGFFDYKTYSSQAGSVGVKLSNMARYTRHQNLPVRGVLRRRPLGNTSAPSSTNTVVDFLLLGGFNSVGHEEHNKSVVSGAFVAMTWSASGGRSQMFYPLAINPLTLGWDSMCDRLLYCPDVVRGGNPYILGDCCAEYVEERDEVICFGGRSSESDTAVAHATLAVLDFKQTTPGTVGHQAKQLEGRWVYQQYPDMPHPRWSAASVLIKGLVRKGETTPCDRIFIIGGRNREGFVAEVDVLNLSSNRWETDWKGLDQGELETADGRQQTAGTTIIVQGGGDGIKSIKAGEGISVTGDSKNPTVAANVADIVNRIIQNEAFKAEIAQKITENTAFRNQIATAMIGSSAFQAMVAELLLSDGDFRQSIIDAVTNNPAIINSITAAIASNPAFLQNVTQTILGNQAFVNQVIDAVVNNATLVSNIAHQIGGHATFINTVMNQLVSNPSFVATIVELMLGNASFMATVVQQVTNSQSFVNSVKQTLLSDAHFTSEIINSILDNGNFRQEIIQTLAQNNALIQSISETMIASSTFITSIAGEILNDQAVFNQIIYDVVNNDFLVNNIVQNVVSHQALLQNITYEIINNETLIGDIVHQVVHNPSLHNQIIEQVISSPTFIGSVTNQIINNETIVNNLTQEIVNSQDLFQYITNNLLASSTFVNNVAGAILSHQAFVNLVIDAVVNDASLVSQMVSAVSLVAPDGSSIATNDGGKLTVQVATNSQFGIVKGQSNTSPAAWHLVSATDGLLSINRLLLEAFIDERIKKAMETIPTGGGGGNGSDIEERIRQLLESIHCRCLRGAKRYCQRCCCLGNPCAGLGLENIDKLLKATVRDKKHLDYPMCFPNHIPRDRAFYFGKLTHIDKDLYDSLNGLRLESIDTLLKATVRDKKHLDYPMCFPNHIPKDRTFYFGKLTHIDNDFTIHTYYDCYPTSQ